MPIYNGKYNSFFFKKRKKKKQNTYESQIKNCMKMWGKEKEIISTENVHQIVPRKKNVKEKKEKDDLNISMHLLAMLKKE